MRLDPYLDPLSGHTYEDMVAMAEATNRLGVPPEALSSLDEDWLAREGFDPRIARIVPGRYNAGGIYFPGQPSQKDIDTLGGRPLTKGDIAIMPESIPGSANNWDLLSHEFRHKGLEEKRRFEGNDEPVVRAYDFQYGSPAMKAETLRAKEKGLYYPVLWQPEEAVMADIEAAKQRGRDAYPIPAAGPVGNLQAMMKGFRAMPGPMPEVLTAKGNTGGFDYLNPLPDKPVPKAPQPAPQPAPQVLPKAPQPAPQPAPQVLPKAQQRNQHAPMATRNWNDAFAAADRARDMYPDAAKARELAVQAGRMQAIKQPDGSVRYRSS